MDGLFTNKVLFSVFATGLLFIGVNEVSHGFFHTEKHEKPGYFIDVPEDQGSAGGADEEEAPVDYLALMTAADPVAGQAVAVKCQQCHTFEQGGEALQGPNLFNIMGRDIASNPSFKYSSGDNGLEGKAGNWDYVQMNAFLERPKGFASATAMNFVGLRKEKDRFDMMAYLRSLNSGTPIAMPEPLPEIEEVVEAAVEGAEAVLEEGAQEATDAAGVDVPAIVEEVVEEAVEAVEEAAPADH